LTGPDFRDIKQVMMNQANHIRSTVPLVLVAAGRGHRAGGGLPKQYRPLMGIPVLVHTLKAVLADARIHPVQCVIHPDDLALYQGCIDRLDHADQTCLLPVVSGGQTRQASVKAGLEALHSIAEAQDHTFQTVLIHDAARPFVSAALLDRAFDMADHSLAAIPALAVTDTLKWVDEVGQVGGTAERPRLRAVQTPQVFSFAALIDAHRRAANAGQHDLTDDAAVMELSGHPVHFFEGDPNNIKLTLEDDFRMSEARMQTALIPVTGLGYDVHAFTIGDHVWLGGVRVAHDRGVRAHSDGDVILHALTDALLGALADGDIGQHFPPSDEQWRGASSDRFVTFAVNRIRQRGGRLVHVDITLVCETPRLGPHRTAILAVLSRLCGLPTHKIGLKATTSEKMGFTGRGEGLAAQAIATVLLPD